MVSRVSIIELIADNRLSQLFISNTAQLFYSCETCEAKHTCVQNKRAAIGNNRTSIDITTSTALIGIVHLNGSHVLCVAHLHHHNELNIGVNNGFQLKTCFS